MIIDITTQISLYFELKEYNELLQEIENYLEDNDTDFNETLSVIWDDLISNDRQISPYTMMSTLSFKYAGEFFKDIKEDIEEVDNEIYPLLCNLLITIANSI
jgi:hypothetical protein